jgi:iron complex transport system permease protein
MTVTTPRALPAIADEEQPSRRIRIGRPLGLVISVVVLLVVGLLSLRIGSLGISTRDAWDAVFHYNDTDYEQMVVRTLRVPRTIIAMGVGAGLAVAGATMQAVTRNPLADSSILGVSSGASFAIVTAIFYFGITAPYQYVWFAFAGSFVAAALVFIVGAAGRDGPTPVKLALAGVIITSLLGAWTSTLLLLDERTMDVVRFWLAGSMAGRELDTFWQVAPFLLGGSLICVFMGHQLNVMSMGEETARALGMNTTRIRLACSILVVLITGAAVAAAGPIAFVGLATPHIVRAIVGPDYRWILPFSLVGGAIFLTTADIVGRVVAKPSELQVGIVTALIGAPFLVYLARQRTVAN